MKKDVKMVDVLVNNAGIVTGRKFLQCPDNLIQKTMDVNIMAHFWVSSTSQNVNAKYRCLFYVPLCKKKVITYEHLFHIPSDCYKKQLQICFRFWICFEKISHLHIYIYASSYKCKPLHLIFIEDIIYTSLSLYICL